MTNPTYYQLDEVDDVGLQCECMFAEFVVGICDFMQNFLLIFTWKSVVI